MYKESVTEIKKRSRHVRENANKKQKIEKNLIFNKNKVCYYIRYDALTLQFYKHLKQFFIFYIFSTECRVLLEN